LTVITAEYRLHLGFYWPLHKRQYQAGSTISTPVHGIWLNIAKCELSVLTKQRLRGCIGSMDEVRKQVTAWTAWRNDHTKGVHWQFTTDDAQIKLDSVYPKFQFDNEGLYFWFNIYF